MFDIIVMSLLIKTFTLISHNDVRNDLTIFRENKAHCFLQLITFADVFIRKRHYLQL